MNPFLLIGHTVSFFPTASAMKVLQSKAIVHRDLKPQNILLSYSGITQPRPIDIKIKIGNVSFRYTDIGMKFS